MDYQLKKLEKESFGVIRDARDKFKNLAILESGSKESKVCLYLCKRTFFGKIPFPVLQLKGVEDIKKAIDENNLEALIVGTKLFDSLSDFKDNPCLRICPLVGWKEFNLWQYIKENNIPVNENPEEIITKLKTDQPDSSPDDQEKEEIMQRLKELGYT